MASLTHKTWALANSGRWWSTGKPGVLQFVGLQRVGHDWASEQQKIITPSGYCFMQDKIWAVLTSCPYWSYDLYQSFFLTISVFGMSILFAWICLKIFFFSGKNVKLPKKSCLLSYNYLASLDSANFFDNLKTYHSFFFFRVVFFTLHLFRPSVLTEMLIVLRKAFWPVSSKSSFTIQSHVDILFYL